MCPPTIGKSHNISLKLTSCNFLFWLVLLAVSPNAFVFYGCCNKPPWTWWLKTTAIYSVTIMAARSLKSASLFWNQGVHRAKLPPQHLEDSVSFASFSSYWLPAFLGLWSHQANLCLYDGIVKETLFCAVKSPFLPSKGPMWLHLGWTLIIQDTVPISRYLIMSAKKLYLSELSIKGHRD